MEKIIVAGGCFWCIEAAFNRLKGVERAVSGYCGGSEDTANYQDVCSGLTEHAEAVEITYDPAQIDLVLLLEVFFTIHDPTQLNGQGNDIGPQYRSAIFCLTDKQLQVSHDFIQLIQRNYSSPIVTQVEYAKAFFAAEGYHQGYFDQNPQQGYCQFVVAPKMKKFTELFMDKLK
ncbi:peptide methionine sulfoxide reductase [Catenovulum agarivorans DS-2]|uniref:Peptide methionine sulfoxide reductase MsrA n=1 Tax=Catenovulum agarivorans DS-2 TaxID=1328313 RepID=W7QBS2_9ALTE|nr:peptide-methionine (S)-S-oxide reductase MsrA [Catenovulum agarivorans]EWH09446.1 peptide methionine sulfoxide reductase [Catenovulum agarivorans DS-2]